MSKTKIVDVGTLKRWRRWAAWRRPDHAHDEADVFTREIDAILAINPEPSDDWAWNAAAQWTEDPRYPWSNEETRRLAAHFRERAPKLPDARKIVYAAVNAWDTPGAVRAVQDLIDNKGGEPAGGGSEDETLQERPDAPPASIMPDVGSANVPLPIDVELNTEKARELIEKYKGAEGAVAGDDTGCAVQSGDATTEGAACNPDSPASIAEGIVRDWREANSVSSVVYDGLIPIIGSDKWSDLTQRIAKVVEEKDAEIERIKEDWKFKSGELVTALRNLNIVGEQRDEALTGFDEARAKVERLRGQLEVSMREENERAKERAEARDLLEKERATVKALRGALEFYADEGGYWTDRINREVAVEQDRGAKARTALNLPRERALAEARDAVVEAADTWFGIDTGSDRLHHGPIARRLCDAVRALRALEEQHNTKGTK